MNRDKGRALQNVSFQMFPLQICKLRSATLWRRHHHPLVDVKSTVIAIFQVVRWRIWMMLSISWKTRWTTKTALSVWRMYTRVRQWWIIYYVRNYSGILRLTSWMKGDWMRRWSHLLAIKTLWHLLDRIYSSTGPLPSVAKLLWTLNCHFHLIWTAYRRWDRSVLQLDARQSPVQVVTHINQREKSRRLPSRSSMPHLYKMTITSIYWIGHPITSLRLRWATVYICGLRVHQRFLCNCCTCLLFVNQRTQFL